MRSAALLRARPACAPLLGCAWMRRWLFPGEPVPNLTDRVLQEWYANHQQERKRHQKQQGIATKRMKTSDGSDNSIARPGYGRLGSLGSLGGKHRRLEVSPVVTHGGSTCEGSVPSKAKAPSAERAFQQHLCRACKEVRLGLELGLNGDSGRLHSLQAGVHLAIG